jgi:hypothetical protein
MYNIVFLKGVFGWLEQVMKIEENRLSFLKKIIQIRSDSLYFTYQGL